MDQIKLNEERKYNHFLWVEKYRPVTVSDIILPAKYKSAFTKMVNQKEIPNLLIFSSSAGTAKSSVGKAIIRDIKANNLYINGSVEGGIDTLRTTIEQFATTCTYMEQQEAKVKIVFIDEFDGVTRNLQDGLRAAMEEFSGKCRFIFTCNYLSKITDPIKSRCQLFDFNMTDIKIKTEMVPKIIKRLGAILKHEKLEYDQAVIPKIVEKFYPDMRSMLQLLQQYSQQAGVIDANIFSFSSIDMELFDLILNKKWGSVRKFVIERSYNFSELYKALYDNLLPMVENNKKLPLVLIINEGQVNDSIVIDKEINFMATIAKIMEIL